VRRSRIPLRDSAAGSQHSAQGENKPLDAGKLSSLLALAASADATNNNAKALDAQAQTARVVHPPP